MKNKPLIIVLIVLLSIITLCVSSVFVFLLVNKNFSFDSFIGSYKVSKQKIFDRTFDEDFSGININSNASEIKILESDNSTFRVVIYGSKYSSKDKFSVEDYTGKLDIKLDKEPCKGFCFNRKIYSTIVYIPANYDKKLIINNKYGDIHINDFESMDLNAKLNAGDIKVGRVNTAKITNDYGDIFVNYAKKIDVLEKCGDVEIKEVNSVTVKNNYGDIDINKVNEYLNAENNCGDISINNLNILKNSQIKDDLGDIEIGSTNEIRINASTSLGDTKIRNNYKSDITLDIKNSCGDIEVNN